MFAMQKESIPFSPSVASSSSNKDFIAGIPGN